MLAHYLVNSLLLGFIVQASTGSGFLWSFESDPVGGLPAGWEIRGSGTSVYQVQSTPDGNRFLTATSRGSDSQVGIQLSVEAREYPALAWRWRVLELPRGGDERNIKTLDSGASVYAVFGSRLFPRILKYVWSTSAPTGTSFKHPTSGRMAIFVVNSGAASLGQWQQVKRNIVDDFREAFGSAPGNLIAIAVKTDSDSTRSSARADYDDIQLMRR